MTPIIPLIPANAGTQIIWRGMPDLSALNELASEFGSGYRHSPG